jgi:hypothetical protein
MKNFKYHLENDLFLDHESGIPSEMLAAGETNTQEVTHPTVTRRLDWKLYGF